MEKQNTKNGYGDRDYKNDIDQKEGVNNHHDQLKSGEPIAKNNQNSEQLDEAAQAQSQGTINSDKTEQDYSNHETKNAQFQQVEGQTGDSNQFDQKFAKSGKPDEGKVVTSNDVDTTHITSEQTHGNTSGYDQGYTSDEGLRQLKDMKPSSQMKSNSPETSEESQLKGNSAQATAHEGYHQTK
jgi:hypothetical protein